jgi:ubiquinone/menaquinone biosynthesis C-methylase UbiE
MMASDRSLEQITAAGWAFPQSVWEALPPEERSFALLEFAGTRTVEFYRRRIHAIGFVKREAVLDAGCGMGQWSAVLAEANAQVEGIDLNKGRLRVAKTLCTETGLINCSFRGSSMEALPYPNACFDLVFCYGAFMFTHMPQALSEFARVLRPNGRLYLNANSYGWYAHLIIDQGLRKRNWPLVRQAAAMVRRAYIGGEKCMLVREKWLKRLLDRKGFDILGLGAEGHVTLDATSHPLPGYPEMFYGMRSIIEVVATRRPS